MRFTACKTLTPNAPPLGGAGVIPLHMDPRTVYCSRIIANRERDTVRDFWVRTKFARRVCTVREANMHMQSARLSARVASFARIRARAARERALKVKTKFSLSCEIA